MSPKTLESSLPEQPPESNTDALMAVDDTRRGEIIAKRIARLGGNEEVPFIDRVHDENQRRDPETTAAPTRYLKHPHLRGFLKKLGPRHDAGKK